MLELFAFGTLAFWGLIFVLGVIITVLVENEQGPWATTVAIATAVALNWLWKIPILHTVSENKLAALVWLLAYYVLGVVWMLIKWTAFVHKGIGKYNEFKADFLKASNATELTPELAAKLKEKIESRYGAKNVDIDIPTARENKGRIIRWMTYWPFSIIGTLLNDVVRKLWHHIYTFLATTLDRISVKMWRGVSADMAMAKQFKDEQDRKEAEAKAQGAEARAKQYDSRRY